MPKPGQTDYISETASTMKVRYPQPRRKRDPYGIKFRRGHRTHQRLEGRRPLFRSPKR